MKEAKTIFEPEKPTVPHGWEILPFQKAAIVVSDKGKRIKQSAYLPKGKIPVIDQGQEYIKGYTNDKNMSFEGELPVILFGDHTRSVKYVNQQFAIGAEGVKILKPSDYYDPKFFYFLLKSLQIPSRGYSRHFQFLKKFYLPVAPKNQQKLIVDEIEKQFSRLDEAIANLKRVKANLKRYRAAVLKAAVEGKLTEEWRKQHPDVESASKFLKCILSERKRKWEAEHPGNKYKEPAPPDTSKLPELPRGWVWTSFEQLIKESQNGLSKRSGDQGKPVFVLRLADVIEGEICETDPRSIKLTSEELGKYLLKSGDLVCIRVNGSRNLTGRLIVFNSNNKWAYCDHFVRFRIFNKYVSERFLDYFFDTEIARDFIEHNMVSSAGQNTVSQTTMFGVPVPLAPLEEQKKIIESIENMLSVTDNVNSYGEINLKRAERLRQSILKKAFLGKLITHDVNYYQKI